MFLNIKAKSKPMLAIPASILLALGTTTAIADDVNFDIYGNVHVSMNSQDNSNDGNGEFKSNTSAFGIKGDSKLDDGLEVIFKLEWQVDVTFRNSEKGLVDRDQWIGFKSKFGQFIFGTASSNYKAKGGKVDPLYRTPLEGRSAFMATQSRQLHAGAGIDRGRMTKSVNYTSKKYNNFQYQLNTTLSGSDDESYGGGVRYQTKKSLFYVDIISDGVSKITGDAETATKVGGYYKFGKFQISGQFEASEDVDGSDYWFLGGTYKLSKEGTLKFTTGAADGVQDSQSLAILYDHKLGRNTNAYIGWGSKNDDLGDDDSLFTVGARYKF